MAKVVLELNFSNWLLNLFNVRDVSHINKEMGENKLKFHELGLVNKRGADIKT